MTDLRDSAVGLIPKDWECTTVGSAYEIHNQNRLPLSRERRSEMAGRYPYYGPTGVLDYINEYRFDGKFALIGEDGDHFLKFSTHPMTLLVSGRFNVNNHAHVVGPHGTNLAEWFQAYFENRDIAAHLTRQGAGRYKLTKAALLDLPMALPPKTEQQTIVNALSDISNLLRSLEKVIAKKQAIKQGLMQQLLTGKTRLPGFTDPWIEVRLGEIARVKTGSRNNQDKEPLGQYPFFVRSAMVERINSYSYDCEAILVPGEGGIGSIFHYVNGRFEVHQRVYKISDFAEQVSGRFVYHYMRQFFGAHAMENSVKATVDSLRLPTFNGFELHLPVDLDEQQAVVDVLDNTENEIALLQRRLAKARSMKTGMMQQLLTGRTRLPVEESAA